MNRWEDWIGRTSSVTAALDARQANHMEALLDRAPVLADGDALPPGWHWLYFHQPVRASDLGPDGHATPGLTLPDTGLPRRMWAGGRLELIAPLRLGTPATRTTTIAGIEPKAGRGGRLCFVTLEHEVSAAGEVALRERQALVYREAATAGGAVEPPAAPSDAGVSETWTLDAPALFRYSALTGNSHRIHYDADFCREVEGYPNVVVHGPLLATLLLDLAARHAELVRFDYRARSPLFLPSPFTVNGREAPAGGEIALWVAGPSGALVMEATAASRS